MDSQYIPRVCLVVLVCMSLCCHGNGEKTLTDRRIRVVRDSVIMIDRALAKVESRELGCNDTMYEISGRLDKVNRRVKRLYKGPLFATVNIKQGFRDYDNVLLVLPDPIKTCIDDYKGTQVSNAQATITCIRQIFWRYEPPKKRRKVEEEKKVVVNFASMVKDKIEAPPVRPPPPPPPSTPAAPPITSPPRSLTSWLYATYATTSQEYATYATTSQEYATYATTSQEYASQEASSKTEYSTPGTSFALATSATTHESGTTSSPFVKRRRMEYRTLSVDERTRFHNALNALYKDGTIAAFAALHAAASEGAYNGPAFLPWHRVFLTTFEDAIQAVDPEVTLPYWDSTLDDCMDVPINSIIWTPGFLGNGAGRTVVGPSAHWVTNMGFLERRYAMDSRLISRGQVEDLLSRCKYEEITAPTGDRRYRLETLHNNVNAWVGGEMNGVKTGPYDPIFYLHHCFIDYLWEKFRQNQRTKCGVDPETDYIDINGPHNFDKPMAQIKVFNNSEGLLNRWSDIVQYVDSPTCDNNCGGSDVLYCNRSLNCCVPVSKFDVPWDTLSSSPEPATTADSKPGRAPERSDRCEWFYDPTCFYRRIAAMEKRGRYIPLSATDELEIVDSMMPRQRGKVFDTQADDGDGRSLLSAAIAEGYEGLSVV